MVKRTHCGSDGSVPQDVETSEPKAKRCNAAAGWCFTWFDFPENWADIIRSKQGYLKGWVAGEEVCPSTGRKHIQGFVEFTKKNRPLETLKFGSHWEAARASAQRNEEYTTKDGVYLSWGTCKVTKYKLELTLRPWQQELFDILCQEPDDRTIHWIWEDKGNVGKSLFTKWLCVNYAELGVIVTGGKVDDVLHQVAELHKAKKLPRRIILDLPRSYDQKYLRFHALEQLKNMCFYSGKYEGGMVVGPCPWLVVFANCSPPLEELSADRWKVGRIAESRIVWD